MSIKIKAALINLSLLCGLAYEYWKGAPRLSVSVAGLLLLVIANTLLLKAYRKPTRATNAS